MDVNARRGQTGEYFLELGPVVFELDSASVNTLQNIIRQRLSQPSGADDAALSKKLHAYRVLATKMNAMDDRILQKFATQVSQEQLVTLVRLSEGDRLFHKVVRNLSRQNGKQFQQDYHDLNKITTHQASLYMEQLVPMIRKAVQEQKAMLRQP